MKIIKVSEDQNTVKTDDSKEHEFVECDLEVCNEDICSLYKYNIDCPYLCCGRLRKDGKEGYFKLKNKFSKFCKNIAFRIKKYCIFAANIKDKYKQ